LGRTFIVWFAMAAVIEVGLLAGCGGEQNAASTGEHQRQRTAGRRALPRNLGAVELSAPPRESQLSGWIARGRGDRLCGRLEL
jgi:hypothetical protein